MIWKLNVITRLHTVYWLQKSFIAKLYKYLMQYHIFDAIPYIWWNSRYLMQFCISDATTYIWCCSRPHDDNCHSKWSQLQILMNHQTSVKSKKPFTTNTMHEIQNKSRRRSNISSNTAKEALSFSTIVLV